MDTLDHGDIMSNCAIEIKNVSKRFRERGKWFYALKNISFSIKRGEIFGLLGPNGAGKTTLLNLIINILEPDSGYIRVFGRDVSKDREVMEQINFVSGETRFHWTLTVKDILNFYGKSYGLKKPLLEKRVNRLAKFFGIEHVMNRKFDYISTGEKMRLIFVKALLNNPKLLLFDEPTLGLDPSMAIKIRKEIKRINKKGVTILLTSHYMHEVEQLSDRVGFIYRGQLIDIGSVEKVKLKRFTTYDVIVDVEKIKNEQFLRKQGFRIKGRKLYKTVSHGESLSKNEPLFF
jgi:ABC-2 type transport system ATP-binding protein